MKSIEEKSRCSGCYHAIKEGADPKSEYCRICIRNPVFPTTRMPKTAIIDGIKVKIPQDFYITKDRKELEDKKLRRELELKNFKEKLKKKDFPFIRDPKLIKPFRWVPAQKKEPKYWQLKEKERYH